MLHFLSMLCISSVATSLRIPEERIVNGKEIDISETPHQVALLYRAKEPFCGGAILSRKIIITAAHCLNDLLPGDISIVAGSKYWNKGGQRIKVQDFKIHEDFNFNIVRAKGDVAVLLLAQPLKYNSKVKPIAIARKSPKVGDIGSVSGWGSIKYSPLKYPEDLRGVDLQIIKVSNDVIRTNPGLKNVYHGDSGGPLVVNKELVGVVSAGNVYAPPAYPNLAHYYNWIQNAVTNLVHAQ